MKTMLPLKKTVHIFLFHADGTAEMCHIESKPNGFGSYQQAWQWIYDFHLPAIAGVGEVYSRG